MRLKRAALIALVCALSSILGQASWAQTRLRLVHTASSLLMPVFIADEKGFFAEHGLKIEFTQTSVNSQIPAALVSNSADIGFVTTSSLVQANDNGIDLRAIAGTGIAFPGATNEAMVARNGSNIHTAKDYLGRKVGVPGIGVVMDIMFRNWLMKAGVDPAKVTFVEVPNPQQLDALRVGAVDAVVANDPQLPRLIQSGAGYEAGKFMDALPGEMPIIVYAVTQEWGEAHRKEITEFQDADKEGVAYVQAHPDEAREVLVRRLKLPPAVAKDLEIPPFRPDVKPEQIKIMLDMLKAQNMLTQTDLNPASMVWH
jgi:NitT/TauT family transport system substrate-binding protein